MLLLSECVRTRQLLGGDWGSHPAMYLSESNLRRLCASIEILFRGCHVTHYDFAILLSRRAKKCLYWEEDGNLLMLPHVRMLAKLGNIFLPHCVTVRRKQGSNFSLPHVPNFGECQGTLTVLTIALMFIPSIPIPTFDRG